MNVQLTRATPTDRATLDNLFQLYIHDFSEHWAGRERGELNADGRFAPYPLDPYWSEPEHIPLLLTVDHHLAGFVLLNATSHLNEAIDRNVAEFFVVRKHRRGGVGRRAIHQLFDAYPGEWEMAVARANTAALAFWRAAIHSAPRTQDFVEHNVQSSVWNGFILRVRLLPRST